MRVHCIHVRCTTQVVKGFEEKKTYWNNFPNNNTMQLVFTSFHFVRRFLPLYILVLLDSSVDDGLVSDTVC